VIPISPYCAREAIGGTSALPRTVVGDSETVGDGAAVADGLPVGVELELAGVTQAPTTSVAMIRLTGDFIDGNSRAPWQPRVCGLARSIET
jgi:hypothetical protein